MFCNSVYGVSEALVMALGSDVQKEGTDLMFEVLQKPRLNKQVITV